MPEKKQYTQLLALIAASGLVILIAVGSTLYFSDALQFTREGGDSGGVMHENVTMTDAQMACEERARRDFGRRQSNLTVDSRSSRLDLNEGLYKIFMTVDLFSDNRHQGAAETHQVVCFVNSRRLRIETFQYAADGEYVTPGEEGRGRFGL